jgi:plasmid stabilization system protein ParE
MTYRVVVTARARADALEAYRWLVEQSPTAAARWYATLEKAIARLSKLPERNPIAEDDSEQCGITLRQTLYGRRPGVYRILYSDEDDTVTLHSIRHAARGPL